MLVVTINFGLHRNDKKDEDKSNLLEVSGAIAILDVSGRLW